MQTIPCDFVSYNILCFSLKPIYKKNFWIFWKIEKNIFSTTTPKGPHFGKKFKNKKNSSFFQKIRFFQTESEYYIF